MCRDILGYFEKRRLLSKTAATKVLDKLGCVLF